ncbi:MAG: hypothetical protein WCI62_03385, partial [Erysipelotrichaceae bacterium]
SSISSNHQEVQAYIDQHHPIVIALNFIPDSFKVDYVFSTHMRRYSKIQEQPNIKTIITSNLRDAKRFDYMINFSSYSCQAPEILDNSGAVCLNFLYSLGTKKVTLAGLDGYDKNSQRNYVNSGLEFAFGNDAIDLRNRLLKNEIDKLKPKLQITFLTPSIYN